MAAYTHNTGGVIYFDSLTGGSSTATLDSHAISNSTTLTVRTDTYSCPNHSTAVGSLDTVTFSGIGGTLHFDPTYTRHVAYTGGGGNVPSLGTVITANNGTTGILLGVWANWLSEPVVSGNAMPTTGYIKLGEVSSHGGFNAGALTGITATCSGADVQSFIEIRGADTATITVPRIGKVTSTEAWFELGTTNGSRGQILACPTTATNAGVFAGVQIETSAGSGVYEWYTGVGSQVALSTTRTDASCKFVWSTTTGIRIGNNGTNNVGYLPVTGCKVRIPAIILTNCTRTAGGSGTRVLPNATIATRQEFVTTGAGYFDLRGIVSQWYMNFSQAFYVKYLNCAINDAMILSEIASPLDVSDCLVSPTQAQINTALQVASCFAGGTIQKSKFVRFSLASSGNYVSSINYTTGVAFTNNQHASLTLRANGNTSCITSTQAVSCTFEGDTFIGGRGLFVAAQSCTFNNTKYYDHTITTTTSATNPMSMLEFTTGGNGNVVSGIGVTLPANLPYTALVTLNACYNTEVKLTGTNSTTPYVMNASVTGVVVNGVGNCDGVKIKRVFVSNTRTGLYSFVNSDNNITVENSMGDYADTNAMAGLNAVVKGGGFTGSTTGQTSVYGTHWLTRFTSTTAGFAEVLCNEPTAASAAQCSATGGTPQFNSSGSVLLTKVGDQVTWEMPFFAIGYTAFTNSAPVITGTNVTFSSGSTWGNHTLEYQVNTGSGYGGTWLALNAASLITNTFNSTTGFKLKIRATCLTANAGNVLTNLRVALTTTSTDQSTKLYPLSTNTLTLTGFPTGTDIVILTAGTSTILAQQDSNPTSTYVYTYEGTPTVDIGFIKSGYVPYYIRNLALGSSNSSLPIVLTTDRNYI
jgi:hypothetical protein